MSDQNKISGAGNSNSETGNSNSETGSSNSAKRDADGVVKSSSSFDQVCSLPTKTTLYSNFTNVILVKLSLQKRCDYVKVVFSKQFSKLLRENGCSSDRSPAVNRKCRVLERDKEWFTFIQVTFSHSASLKSKLESGYHIANFVSLCTQPEMVNTGSTEVNLNVHQKTQLTSEPKVVTVLLHFNKHVDFDQETLRLYHIHKIIGDSIEFLNFFIKPCLNKIQNLTLASSQLLLRSKTGRGEYFAAE